MRDTSSGSANPPAVSHERPPEGLGRGAWSAPPWVVASLGAAIIVVVALYFWLRHRRHKRAAEQGPPSSSPLSSRR
jgi:hypothetical protein